MNGRLQEPPYDQEEPSMPPLARIEEIVRDCLATCSRAPHPKAPDAASNLRHHMQAIERDLYEVRDLLAALRRSTETDSPVSKHDVLLAAAKHDLAYSEGFVSGWNSGLKTVSPDASDRARGHAASRAAERMGEDARAVIRVARSRSTETDKAVPAPATGGEDDEMYEIGKRDGYEEAVQDIDLLTGGDGEYRVSVFLEGGVDDDRHCPDPAAMKARIAERFAALRRPETDKPGVREAGWRPIETAPKDGVDVILGTGPQMYQGRSVPARVTVGHWTTEEECRIDIGDCGGDCHCREYEYADPSWISWDGGFTEENPATHWMPLPEAPDRALSASPLTEEQPVTWQDIATAPKVADKTLLLRIEHMNFAIAPAEDKARWEEVVTAYWTDFNNGGWVWHGLAGLPTHWTPLPPLPRSTTGGAK